MAKEVKVKENEKEIVLKEIVLKENELLLPTGEHTEDGEAILVKKTIKPTKLLYMANKDYFGYQYVEQVGASDIFNFGDGYDIVVRFLTSVFNDKEYAELIFNDLDTVMLEDIIKVSKKVSHIKEDSLKNVMEMRKEESQ